ncbi:hypothetical protein [Guptibacillus hwajinpoensis]|uniref:hypothetical protein n=1 Tax=Guptibacillus hwajinpoensis TaxID=208199 RepID=UPI0024B3AD48|nr:hypothetical protein [Pseudalkalibacillus hwajinpoensis]
MKTLLFAIGIICVVLTGCVNKDKGEGGKEESKEMTQQYTVSYRGENDKWIVKDNVEGNPELGKENVTEMHQFSLEPQFDVEKDYMPTFSVIIDSKVVAEKVGVDENEDGSYVSSISLNREGTGEPYDSVKIIINTNGNEESIPLTR